VVFLPRLKVSLPFESGGEEHFALCLDADLTVRSVERAAPVDYHDLNGKVHSYTADFHAIREGNAGQLIQTIYECKPAHLLRGIIHDDLLAWQQRRARLEQDGFPLLIVTDIELKGPPLAHAQEFTPFFHSVPEQEFRARLLAELQAGPLSRKVLLDRVRMRFHASHQTSSWHLRLQDTFFGLVARGEIHADRSVLPDDDCSFWLSSLAQPTETAAFGLGVDHYVRKAMNGWEDAPEEEPTLQEDEFHRLAQQAFLKSERGSQYLELFSQYPDPREPLDADRIEELRAATKLSARSIFRFKDLLFKAGAPGITFQQLIPFLRTDQRAPSNTVARPVQEIMEDKVNTYYLRTVGFNERCKFAQNLYRLIREDCQKANLAPPAQTTIKRYLDRLYLQDPVAFTAARYGTEEASKLIGRQGGAPATYYGEVVGVDCTPCDVLTHKGKIELVMHPRGKDAKEEARTIRAKGVQRATMIQFTEEASSEIILSYLVPGAASAAIILDGFRRLFQGDHELQRLAGVTHFTPFLGLPLKVRIDSGNEFKNRHIKRALQTLGVAVVQRNKGTRHLGGLEERTIGTLVRTHHILPGTTMENVQAKGEYNAPKGATLSFEMLAQYQQLNVEQYNLDCAPRRGVSRHEHAQELIRQGKVRLRQPSPEQRRFLIEQMQPVENRTCLRTGVHLFSLTYTSPTPEMEHLIRRQATVELVYNPADIRSIQLVHPDTGLLLKLTAKPFPGVDLSVPLAKSTWELFHRRLNSSRTGVKDRLKSPQALLDQVRTEQGLRLAQEPAPQNQVLDVKPAPEQDDEEIPLSTLTRVARPTRRTV